jgi:hypothetical protein
MKVIIQLLFVAVFLAVLSVEADKPTGETDSIDFLDKDFYGIEGNDDTDSDSGEEEDSDETTTTLSPRGGRGRFAHRFRGGKGRHSQRAKSWRKTMTPDEKLESICQSINSKSTIFQSKKMSMKLRRVDPETKQKVEAYYSARTAAMSECCLLNGPEKMQCAENIRSERYTRVCNGEEPLCIWSLLKGREGLNQKSETVTKCCEVQGEERNSCFLAAKQKYFAGRFHGRHRKNKD